jgi:mannose-6-phosphate isomerase-like protein (cupin superfamily)
MNRTTTVILTCLLLLCLAATVAAQSLDGRPYDPDRDPDIDMFIGNWRESMPRHTHGSLIERDILTQGDNMNPPRKGAALEFVNRFVHATLDAGMQTQPTTLDGEQEIIYIISGEGMLCAPKKCHKLYANIAVLIPAGLEFTMKSTGDTPLTMYLINEPIPEGFRPNDDIVLRDENVMPVDSYDGHWAHIVKYLFETNDGLGTLERILTVSIDPMQIAHPHSHNEGTEEVWTGLRGTSVAWIGREIRMHGPGTAYMIPPDGNTAHANINNGTERITMFYFARYQDHEVRP